MPPEIKKKFGHVTYLSIFGYLNLLGRTCKCKRNLHQRIGEHNPKKEANFDPDKVKSNLKNNSKRLNQFSIKCLICCRNKKIQTFNKK